MLATASTGRALEIQLELPNVRLGIVEAEGVRVASSDGALAQLLDAVCARKRAEFAVESLAEAETTRAVRAMFRAWGIDPSKYRPSSEALLRRVVQGKGLYCVLNIVDIGNVGSIETGWPCGCYDRSGLKPPIVLRHGLPGETYEGIGKRSWHLEGQPVLADTTGPFGSPIRDSTRSMITESAKDVLAIIYAPSDVSEGALEAALARLAGRLSQFAGASAARLSIC